MNILFENIIKAIQDLINGLNSSWTLVVLVGGTILFLSLSYLVVVMFWSWRHQK